MGINAPWRRPEDYWKRWHLNQVLLMIRSSQLVKRHDLEAFKWPWELYREWKAVQLIWNTGFVLFVYNFQMSVKRPFGDSITGFFFSFNLAGNRGSLKSINSIWRKIENHCSCSFFFFLLSLVTFNEVYHTWRKMYNPLGVQLKELSQTEHHHVTQSADQGKVYLFFHLSDLIPHN
jgi:hypothetical protein